MADRRRTADTITDDELDQLHERLARAEAAIARVRDALAHDHSDDCRYVIGTDAVLDALNEPKEPTS